MYIRIINRINDAVLFEKNVDNCPRVHEVVLIEKTRTYYVSEVINDVFHNTTIIMVNPGEKR
jgi:hypothetical protein